MNRCIGHSPSSCGSLNTLFAKNLKTRKNLVVRHLDELHINAYTSVT